LIIFDFLFYILLKMSRYDRNTMRINGYYCIIGINIPVFAFSDDFVCLFDFLLAPIHNIIGLQIKISLNSLNTEFRCMKPLRQNLVAMLRRQSFILHHNITTIHLKNYKNIKIFVFNPVFFISL